MIESLVVDARAVPPEFSADVLLRLTGSTRILDTEWRRELIEEAYLRAYSAWDAYRVTATSTSPNSRQGAQVIASDTALTRVSLQVRAAQLMASVDPVRAREMFEWIDLDLVAGTCDSPLVPAIDEYCTTLAVLARQTFGQDAQGRSDALRFMTLYLFQAHLPTDMPAVARALRTFRPTDRRGGLPRRHLPLDSRQQPARSARLLQHLDRSGHAVHGPGRRRPDARPHPLERDARAQGLPRHTVQGPRCSDSLSDGTAVDTFNAALRRREHRGGERSSRWRRPTRGRPACWESRAWTPTGARSRRGVSTTWASACAARTGSRCPIRSG